MDYEKIYSDLCNRGKKRKKGASLYLEKHHIIPTFFFKKNRKKHRFHDGYLPGNYDDASNITYLTPREHFVAHLLLCKIWSNTKWFHRCRSSVILFFNDNYDNRHVRKLYFNPGFSSKYDVYRKGAIESLSKERRGKMPVKDAGTGKMIGSISVNHPNVISGKWVHHSKGSTVSEITRRRNREASLGLQNGNSRFSDEELVESYYECCVNYKKLVSVSFWVDYAVKYNKHCIKHIKSFRFDNRGMSGLIEDVKNKIEDSGVEVEIYSDYKSYEWRSFAKETKKQWQ